MLAKLSWIYANSEIWVNYYSSKQRKLGFTDEQLVFVIKASIQVLLHIKSNKWLSFSNQKRTHPHSRMYVIPTHSGINSYWSPDKIPAVAYCYTRKITTAGSTFQQHQLLLNVTISVCRWWTLKISPGSYRDHRIFYQAVRPHYNTSWLTKNVFTQ